jgi:hypothetical protein
VGRGETQVDVSALGLDHWETTALHDALSRNPERPLEWREVLLEGVAYLLKFQEDLGRVKRGLDGSPREQAEVRRLFTTDASLGFAMMEQCQRTVDGLVLEGKITDAKKLSGFRNKLISSVGTIKDKLGQEAVDDAEAAAQALVESAGARVPRKRAAASIPFDDDAGKAQSKPRRKLYAPTTAVTARDATPERRSIVKPMSAVAVVLAIVWAVVVLPRLGRTRLPVLEESQLPSSAAFTEVVARPPSLYITVDPAAWGRLPEGDRLQLLADVGRTAEEAGYNGALLRDAGGQPVGQWLRKTGVQLIGD